jgi:hypothetical protein
MRHDILIVPPQVAPEEADQGLAVSWAKQGGLVLQDEGGDTQEADLEGITLERKHEQAMSFKGFDL